MSIFTTNRCLTFRTCPVQGCTVHVGLELLMCARHWTLVPEPMQIAVLGSWNAVKRLKASQNSRLLAEAVKRYRAARAGAVAAVNEKVAST